MSRSSPSSSADGGSVERLQHQLVEPAVAAQLVAEPAQAMVAGQAVGAVGGDHQHPHLRREGASAASSSRVVSSDHCRSSRTTIAAARAEMGEGAAHGLEDRRPLGLLGGIAELGQQQRQVGEEGAAVGKGIGVGAERARSASTIGP